jgi:hypothetical protein
MLNGILDGRLDRICGSNHRTNEGFFVSMAMWLAEGIFINVILMLCDSMSSWGVVVIDDYC